MVSPLGLKPGHRLPSGPRSWSAWEETRATSGPSWAWGVSGRPRPSSFTPATRLWVHHNQIHLKQGKGTNSVGRSGDDEYRADVLWSTVAKGTVIRNWEGTGYLLNCAHNYVARKHNCGATRPSACDAGNTGNRAGDGTEVGTAPRPSPGPAPLSRPRCRPAVGAPARTLGPSVCELPASPNPSPRHSRGIC